MYRPNTIIGIILILLGITLPVVVEGRYFRNPDSDIDPNIFKIDDKKFMGVKISPDLEMLDVDGKAFTFRDFQGEPTILVFSYYTCDGSCSAVNSVLKEMLEDIERTEIGKDYRVLTLSFDKEDTVDTMANFQQELALSEKLKKGWKLGLIKDPEVMEALTKSVGFKYFWSAQDQTFFHPNVYIFLSPEGRVVRYLYALTNDQTDMELAILDAHQGKFRPSQVIELAVSICYSYNYKEGRYTYNIPLFVGAGSFILGVSILVGSLVYFRKFRKS
ncbi:MAG: SCO family protein [Magnetococcales bacterium]|nr:SCO family protein [Magnetococcales bacterium]